MTPSMPAAGHPPTFHFPGPTQMKNPTLATALLLSLGLAACQGNQAPAAATPADAEAASPAPAQAAVPGGDPLPDALPQGVAIDFPYHFIKREEVAASNGNEARLRYTVEYLEGDVASVTASLAESVMEAGFQSGRWQARNDGRTHLVANKAGYGQMQANIAPIGKRKPRNAQAKGIVTLGWPAQDAPAVETADAGQQPAPAAEE